MRCSLAVGCRALRPLNIRPSDMGAEQTGGTVADTTGTSPAAPTLAALLHATAAEFLGRRVAALLARE